MVEQVNASVAADAASANVDVARAVRRVVTGHDANGRSTILFDQTLADGPVPNDRYIWTSAATPSSDLGSEDAAIAPHRLEPSVGGSVFRIVEFPPASVLADMSAEAKESFFAGMFKGMGASHCRVDTTRSPGMHQTATLDYVVMLRGELTLVLDDTETTIRPGDVVVQRGTNHDWVVRGNEPAMIAVVMLSASNS